MQLNTRHAIGERLLHRCECEQVVMRLDWTSDERMADAVAAAVRVRGNCNCRKIKTDRSERKRELKQCETIEKNVCMAENRAALHIGKISFLIRRGRFRFGFIADLAISLVIRRHVLFTLKDQGWGGSFARGSSSRRRGGGGRRREG